jgi:uncharacterized protein (TIGR02145 family)
MSNASMAITFKIHDVAATGVVVYEETHAVTSNSQGLVSMDVGSGTVVTGAFDNINWGGGNKFLQVLMNTGNGDLDLGTQQMMSVPYALYAEDVSVRVSITGDSLFIGDQVSIVPGVSAANPPPLFVEGAGVTDIDGKFYPSIVINGQEWMAKNLSVAHYQNGDPIISGLNDNDWHSSYNTGAFSPGSNEAVGSYYNWIAVSDSRGLCPQNWHVPNSVEWSSLFNSLGGSAVCGLKMKDVTFLGGGSNTSGFGALASGQRSAQGNYEQIGVMAFFWTSTSTYPPNYAESVYLTPYNDSVFIDSYFASTYRLAGKSVRCLKN